MDEALTGETGMDDVAQNAKKAESWRVSDYIVAFLAIMFGATFVVAVLGAGWAAMNFFVLMTLAQ